jgi:ferredoxin
MPNASGPASATGGASGPPTLVLVCGDLETVSPGLVLASLAQEPADTLPGVLARVEAGLCRQPAVIKDAIRHTHAQRLVLGLCAGDYPAWEVQAQVRQAGLDPFGVQVVDLGILRAAAPGLVQRRARALLAASVARARAFSGSRPENQRVAFLPGDQKISRRALFTMPPFIYKSVPSVNQARCAAAEGCNLCVRGCPARAMAGDRPYVVVDKDRCNECGICVSFCPNRAIDFPGWSPKELEAQVSAFLGEEAGSRAPVLLFLCKDAPVPAGNWLPVRVPCAAAVPVAAMLHPLASGWPSVAVGLCHDQCHLGHVALVRGRVDYCQQLLRLVGDAPERVQLWDRTSVAPCPSATIRIDHCQPITLFGPGAAAQAVDRLAAQLATAGPLRLEHPESPLGLVKIKAAACTGCGTCASACPTDALVHQRTGTDVRLLFDPRRCVACGSCISRCPERASHAITLARVTEWPFASPEVLFHDQEIRCQRCGSPIAPSRLLERIAATLGDDLAAQALMHICPDCRGLPAPVGARESAR